MTIKFYKPVVAGVSGVFTAWVFVIILGGGNDLFLEAIAYVLGYSVIASAVSLFLKTRNPIWWALAGSSSVLALCFLHLAFAVVNI